MTPCSGQLGSCSDGVVCQAATLLVTKATETSPLTISLSVERPS